MKNAKYSILLCLIWLASANLSAQQIIYQCDFENTAEHANWHLNDKAATQNPENLWYIDAEGNFSKNGKYGLFVSNNGTTAEYSCKYSMFVTAYRILHLEPGNYQLRFDWRGFGKSDGTEGIYPMLIPATEKTNSSENSADIPDKMKMYLMQPKPLSKDPTWAVANIDFSVRTADDYKICFYWYSKSGTACPPSACIDNIEIVKANGCKMPTNFSHTIVGHNVTIRWTGTADYYDVIFYDAQTKSWQTDTNVTGNVYTFKNFSEGIQAFYVKAHCAGSEETTSGYALYKPFLFWKGERCIDYMDLNNNTCFYANNGHIPQTRGVIDYGFANDSSRHTLHYMDNEYDPITIDNAYSSALITKPAGALASVRIGDRLNGGNSERCQYTYKVTDISNAILKIKYAIVLQDGGHESDVQPRFTINIKHNGKEIENKCGSEDFRAAYGSAIYADVDNWNKVGTDIFWKDWDTLSINLRDYINETITITIEAHDCWQTAHLGYAYFVLECVSGDLAGENCGEGNPTTQVSAPDGFTYNWYRKFGANANKTITTDQEFTIDKQDTAIYCVDVISKTKNGCYYTLDVCGLPRIPIGEAEYKCTSPCHNEYRFYNKSKVIRKTMQGEVVIFPEDALSSLVWDWGDGTQDKYLGDSIDHVFPDKGGLINVRLIASVSNDQCSEVYEMPINMADMTIKDRHVHLVDGQYYDGKYRGMGEYDTAFVDQYGCDRIEHIHVYQKYFPATDTICEGKSYSIADTVFYSGGQKEVKMHKVGLLDPAGKQLDSIIKLDLHEIPMPKYIKADTIKVCGDENGIVVELQMSEKGAMSDSYIEMSEIARLAGFDSIYPAEPYEDGGNVIIKIPLPKNVEPNYYPAKIHFNSEKCDIPTDQILLQVNYPSSIISEKSNKTNGFVTVVDNGNYDNNFIKYTWYRNGVMIYEGSESYVGATAAEDTGAKYEVVITRNDGVSVPSCSYYFNSTTGIEEQANNGLKVYPTLVDANGVIFLSQPASFKVYSILGTCCGNYNNVSEFAAPQMSGIYYIVFNNQDIVKISVK